LVDGSSLKRIRGVDEMRRKVTIIGAGNVGASLAVRLASKEVADVVLIDIVEGIAQGKGLDILECGPLENFHVHVSGANDYEVASESDVVVITAGFRWKPGMSRDGLLMANYSIVKGITEQAVMYSPHCVLLVVTNPVNAMCWTALHASKFDKNRVVGMASLLDATRLRTFIAEDLRVSVESVSVMVMGGHGDAMVPLVRLCSVGGIPLTELMNQENISRLIERTCNGGAEIVRYLRVGSAYYAPAAAAAEMVESIVKDKKKVLPCSAYLDGEYGIRGVFTGVPVILGKQGIEKIYEVDLTHDEQSMIRKSAAGEAELLQILKKII